MTQPFAIDLFCGLGGWTEGLLAEGYRVVGFDIERHVYGEHKYPAQLVLQDALTIHGKQFKDAALIVASPPCQEYSYMAMPWSKAKHKIRDYETGVRDVKQLTALFDACFRIQREASEAAGHHVPMVVENVRGAQRWVGRARWNFGSFYLWGDVPALMPMVKRTPKLAGHNLSKGGAVWRPANGLGLERPEKGTSLAFNDTRHAAYKYFQGESVNRLQDKGVKMGRAPEGKRLTNPGEWARDCGVEKGMKIGGGCHAERVTLDPAKYWSKSPARKYASAMIAKIPLTLSRHIAAVYYPERIS